MNIQLHEVTKRFGSRVALHALEHSLPCRGLTVVGGPNGAGKSVLLKILAGVRRPPPQVSSYGMGFGSIEPGSRPTSFV